MPRPPLCCAVRLQCGANIIQALLDYGASLDAKDVFGRSVAEIARQPQPREIAPAINYDYEATHLLGHREKSALGSGAGSGALF